MSDETVRQATDIIGGVFGLVGPATNGRAIFDRGDALRLVNARSCLFLVITLEQPGAVWIPSFVCDSVVDSIRRAGVEPKFYAVDQSLQVDHLDWTAELLPNDLVIQIDYFGFPGTPDLSAAVRDRGATLVRDASQALLTPSTGRPDFEIFSPRKFIGVPDGGVLLTADERWAGSAFALGRADASWWLNAFHATAGRGRFDSGASERDWFARSQEMERTAPIGLIAMSDLSSMLLDSAFDPQDLAARRRRNFRTLLVRLAEFAVFADLPPTVVPLGFPVRLPNRDEVRNRLFAREIYPPVHWPVAGVVPPSFVDSHALADEIMTLPCDQRYDEEAMSHLADEMLRAL